MQEVKVLIVAYSRQAGGAEKSALKLVSGLISEGFRVDFGTLIQSSRDFYPLFNGVRVVDFFPHLNSHLRRSGKKGIFILPHLVAGLINFRRSMRKEKYDVIISFGAGVGAVTYLGLIGTRQAQITSERIDPNPQVYKPSLVAQLLRPFMYRHGVICSVQTKGFAEWVEKHWRVPTILTPNHFEIPHSKYIFPSASAPVVAVGRPAFQKGYDLLLQAWRSVELHDSRKLLIVADDSEGLIADLIQSNGCENVSVLPLTQDLYSLFDECTLFVSTARFEGYPNAVAEAIIYGIPVLTTISSDIVATWATAGLCQAIPDLSPNVIATNLIQLLKDSSRLQELSNAGIASRDKFNWENNKESWLIAIEKALENTRGTNRQIP